MKLKGISPLEQNVDRIVLGVVGLALVGAVGMQFMPEPKVKVGTREAPRATEAISIVEEEAQTISTRLDSTTLPTPEVKPFSLANQLALGAGTTNPVVQAPKVPLGQLPRISNQAIAARQENDSYALPQVPDLKSGVANVVQVTISPIEKLRNKELDKLLPPVQPFDKTSVSVEFSFNGAELRQHLQADPDGAGPLVPVPLNWWRDQAGGQSADLVDIISVQYERETVSKANGTTPAENEKVVTLPSPPGRVSKLKEWEQSVQNAADVAKVWLPTVQEVSEEIQRPKFYEIVAGPEWQPPSKAVVAGNLAGKVAQGNALINRLDEVNQQIANVEGLIAAAPSPNARDDRDKAPAPAPKGGKGGSSGPAPAGPRPKDDKPQGDRRALEARLKQLTTQRDSIQKQMKELGLAVPGQDGTQAASATTDGTLLPLLENPDVRVWTHDMVAEPGATYRYRARVVINNPLFGRNLQDAQAKLAESSLIFGPWSEWTAPVHVQGPSYFFITSASEANPPVSSQPTASAEMYVFKYGYYRRARVTLTPGDSLFGEANMPKTLKYANMDKLRTLIEDPSADVGGAPAPVDDGGGRRRGAIGNAPPQPQGGDQPVAGDMDQVWSEPVPEREAIKVDVIFLDASTLPGTVRNALGGEEVHFQAMLRDEAGRILVRQPATDAGGELYRKVAESAKAGETQGEIIKPKAIEPPKPRQAPPQRERETVRPRPSPGGGGGGGGGGG